MFSAADQMMLQCPPRPFTMEKKWKSNAELAPNCPRCASSNTKFCYYNNYSLSQPRYFCKGCRRYWTKGGSLRNVPVGGGCRKNRRTKAAVRVSENFSKNLSDIDTKTSSESLYGNSVELVARENGTNGSDIDLAVVFAKFWDQDSGFESEFNVLNEELPNGGNDLVDVPNFLTPNSVPNDTIMVECHQPVNLVQESLFEGLPHVFEAGEKQKDQGETIQQHLESDANALSLQTLFSDDEIAQDDLWCDAGTFPHTAWQPMVQLQEFDTFSVDDQLRISANLVNENNWSSFDLSGFEIFPRP